MILIGELALWVALLMTSWAAVTSFAGGSLGRDDLVASGRLTAESMPELTYPLERAQAFAKQAHARAGDAPPASLAAFETLVARYRAFVDALDRVRREQRGADARAALEEPLKAVEDAANATRAALRGEA